MMTSQKQTSLFTEDKSTSSQEDSHASHTAQQVSDLVKKTIDISGRKCLEQYERLNPNTSWAKMFLASLVGMEGWFSTKCKLTWKLKGTKYNRYYFQLVPSTLRTGGIGFGLLPSPVASDATTGAIIGKNDTFHITKTGMPRKVNQKGTDGSVGLARLGIFGMLPTPNASDNRNRGNPNDPCIKKRIENGKQVGLTMMVDGQLNPPFVMEMMGFPPNWTLMPFGKVSTPVSHTSPFLNGDKNQSKQEETQ
jgi:hypothetical protein